MLLFINYYFIHVFFCCIIRWKAGVAASLAFVDLNDPNPSPLLRPYPAWEENTQDIEEQPSTESRIGGHDNAGPATISNKALTNNASIISTFRIRVDECDRLWVIDSGLADILGNPKQIAPPAIVLFDLNTDRFIKRYTLKPEDMKDSSFFANIVRK